MNSLGWASDAIVATEVAVTQFSKRMKDETYVRDFYDARWHDHDILESPLLKHVMNRLLSTRNRRYTERVHVMQSDLDQIGRRSKRILRRKLAELKLKKAQLTLADNWITTTRELILVPVLAKLDGRTFFDVIILRYTDCDAGDYRIFFEDWIRALELEEKLTSWN